MPTIAEIRESIDIIGSAEAVFAAWTDPDQLIAWWGSDESYRTTDWESDLREGGYWRARGRMADGSPYTVEGRYLRVRAPRELAFTWNPDWSDEPESEVHILIEPVAEGCRLTLVHRGLTHPESIRQHNHGWAAALQWSRAHVERRKRGGQ
jgi:uncharacterized protein YndB with AHSA1/START domain